jgi:hypothetical protein
VDWQLLAGGSLIVAVGAAFGAVGALAARILRELSSARTARREPLPAEHASPRSALPPTARWSGPSRIIRALVVSIVLWAHRGRGLV